MDRLYYWLPGYKTLSCRISEVEGEVFCTSLRSHMFLLVAFGYLVSNWNLTAVLQLSLPVQPCSRIPLLNR